MRRIIFQWVLIYFSFFISHGLAGTNAYQQLDGIQKDILEGRHKAAIERLQNDFGTTGVKKIEQRRDFLLVWAHYFLKDYQKAYGVAKKIVVEFPDSEYYYTALILSARLALKLGDIKAASRILAWIKNNPPAKREFLLAALILERLQVQEIDTVQAEGKLGLDVFRICWEAVKENPPGKTEKTKNVIVPSEASPVKKPEEAGQKPENGKKGVKDNSLESQRDVDIKKSQQPVLAELTRLRQLIDVKEKELRVMRMLLDEKKRLLELKEKYLSEREVLIKKEEDKGESDAEKP